MQKDKQKLVVIGNGMAPGRALEKLFDAAPGAYDVTIFNAEPRVNYDRIMLSPLLSGEKTFEQIVIHGDGWYVKHGVTLHKGVTVSTIDRAAKTVTTARGITVPYDKLLIATGSLPIIIPVPGHKLAGVLSYRDLDDVQAMLLAAKARGSAVVIGGGLLGLEAAVGLKEQGMDVTVLHLMPTLMERQLDTAAGHLLQRAIEARGIRVITKANTKAILGEKKVEAVLLEDGTRLAADLVVMAVGIKPNAQIAKDAGITVNRGIVVDGGMRTSDPDIFAVGECAESHGQVFGLVAPLYDMAGVIARQLTGDDTAAFTPGALATKLKVTGINLYSAGDFAEAPGREEIVLRDPARGVYKRLVLQDDRLIGAVFYGDTVDGAWFFDLIRKASAIGEMRETLIFGPAFAGGTPLDPMAAVAALPARRWALQVPARDGYAFDDFVGGAPDAEIVPIRIGTSVVQLKTSTVTKGIMYAVELCARDETRIHVLSMSMGGVASAAWADAVNLAYEAGIVFVAAAGNNFSAGFFGFPTRAIVYPARFRRVIAACGVMANRRPYYGLPFRTMQGNWGPASKMATAVQPSRRTCRGPSWVAPASSTWTALARRLRRRGGGRRGAVCADARGRPVRHREIPRAVDAGRGGAACAVRRGRQDSRRRESREAGQRHPARGGRAAGGASRVSDTAQGGTGSRDVPDPARAHGSRRRAFGDDRRHAGARGDAVVAALGRR